MMLAFGIDQLQKACCPLFQAALARKERAKCFREDFRSMFTTFRLPDWDTFYRALAFGHEAPVPVPFDTSRPPPPGRTALGSPCLFKGNRHRRPTHLDRSGDRISPVPSEDHVATRPADNPCR